MTREDLFKQIQKKKSFLCIGLDSDISLIPKHLLSHSDPVFEFNKQIIETTRDLCIAYKINTAFYESRGEAGWKCISDTLKEIPPDIFTIADAKRGDIGNTSRHYARAFFEKMNFDAITVSPYMGADSIKSFLEYPGKWAILLALTSNKGAMDFQTTIVTGNSSSASQPMPLYELVLNISRQWGTPDNMMYVVGATRAEQLMEIRRIVSEHFILVPGVGAQGGSLEDVSRLAMNKQCGLIVNASRSIIFASNGSDFAEKAREEAIKLQKEMAVILEKSLDAKCNQ